MRITPPNAVARIPHIEKPTARQPSAFLHSGPGNAKNPDAQKGIRRIRVIYGSTPSEELSIRRVNTRESFTGGNFLSVSVPVVLRKCSPAGAYANINSRLLDLFILLSRFLRWYGVSTPYRRHSLENVFSAIPRARAASLMLLYTLATCSTSSFVLCTAMP